MPARLRVPDNADFHAKVQLLLGLRLPQEHERGSGDDGGVQRHQQHQPVGGEVTDGAATAALLAWMQRMLWQVRRIS